MTLKISITGASQLRMLGSKVQAAFKSSASLAGARTEIASIIADQNRRSFAGSIDPDGNSWPQRAQPKKGRKIRNAKPLLIDTGKLRDSLLAPKTQITNFGRDLRVNYEGEHAFLAAVHSAGYKPHNLPVREVGLRIGRQAREEIQAIAFKRITEAFGKALRTK